MKTRETALHHTVKAKENRKIGLDPPPLALTIDHYCKLSKKIEKAFDTYSLFSSFSQLGPICLVPTKYRLLLSGLAITTVLQLMNKEIS